MRGEVLGVVLIITMIVAGVAVLWIAMVNRRKLMEMAHRERLAMIERGLMPPPEADPAGFERRVLGMRPPSRSSVRFRTAGVLLIGLGFGLTLLIAFAGGAPGTGVGLGGAIALVGVAFVLNALFSARDEMIAPESATPPQASRELREPPTNIVP